MTTMTGSEWLLYRAFSMAEDNCKTPGWQKMIRTGYEVSRLSNPDHPDKHDRIGDDGKRHRHLRNRLSVRNYSVLVIRYGEDPASIDRGWRVIVPEIRSDTRLVKKLRVNPVLLRYLMLWHLRHPELRQARNPLNASSQRTTERWAGVCRKVAEDCFYPAEDAAEAVLRDIGELR